MRFCLVLMLLLSTKLASSQQKKEEHTPPTKDQIDLLLTQSERAFDVYEQTLTQEAAAGGDLGKSALKDKELLVNARELLGRLKKSPDLFNSPGGFLLVGDLDDASRNMSLCMGQAGLASGTEAAAGNYHEGEQYLHLLKDCMDASTLLYTVSETAFNMYAQYLFDEREMMDKAVSALQECTNVLKNNQHQKQ
jgi:hypothetical protein